MASLSKDGPRRWRIQVININGKRRSIRVSNLTKKRAEVVQRHIESIVSCRLQGTRIEDVDAVWLGSLPERFFEKLVKAGLVEPRLSAGGLNGAAADGMPLEQFLDVLISRRKTLKERIDSVETIKIWQSTRDLLLQCFDGDRTVDSFKLGDARAFRQWLETRQIPESKRNPTGKMAENSIRQRIANCKTFFSYAEQEELIEANPFRTQVSSIQDNENGKLRIAADVIDKVIAVAPDAQWKLLIALWRFAGLRKMDPLHLHWDNVLWKKGLLKLSAPKTQHHRGKEYRQIPLRDVMPYLEAAKRESGQGEERIISRYRPTMCNLHKPFQRLIEEAGFTP